MFFSNTWLGVKVWIWLYFFLSIVLGSFVILYWHREKIRRKYYEIRFPERIIKVVLHYKSGFFKEFFRLMPDDNLFVINGKDYHFDSEEILRDNDFFVRKNKKKTETVVKIEGVEYIITDLYKLRKKKRDYPELHYFYNIPKPIQFDYKEKDIKLSAKQLNLFQENDLFSKLLTLDTQRNIFIILMILMIANFLVTFILLAKNMGWIK